MVITYVQFLKKESLKKESNQLIQWTILNTSLKTVFKIVHWINTNKEIDTNKEKF